MHIYIYMHPAVKGRELLCIYICIRAERVNVTHKTYNIVSPNFSMNFKYAILFHSYISYFYIF